VHGQVVSYISVHVAQVKLVAGSGVLVLHGVSGFVSGHARCACAYLKPCTSSCLFQRVKRRKGEGCAIQPKPKLLVSVCIFCESYVR
jgi:hypothetical protein